MKTFIATVLLLMGMTIGSKAYAYTYTNRNWLENKTTVEDLKNQLVPNGKWVTYPQYKDREGWNKLLDKDREDIIKWGEKFLDYRWQVITASNYLAFHRTGSRKDMEKPFNENSTAIAALFMAEMAEGKGRFVEQLENGVFALCEMTSWSLSAHLNSIQLAKRPLPRQNDQIIDLCSGRTSAMLAWIYYFMHDRFAKDDPEIPHRMYEEIKRHTLDVYRTSNRFWWMATENSAAHPGFVNNWNPWCNSDVLQCFLLLENNKSELAKAVYKSMVSVDKYIDYVKGDGACEEGTSYWESAAGKLYDYLQLVTYASGNKIDVMKEPLLKKMGEFICRSYVGNDWVVNFADATAKNGGNSSLIYRFGKAVGSSDMMHFAAYLNQKHMHTYKPSSDLFRLLESYVYKQQLNKETAEINNPSCMWYKDTQFCFMKNNSDLLLAAKGGNNNESHNHNDVGTFSLYMNQTPIFIDAGVGTYTRKTFSNKRYDIWSMQSNYHNLPMINGVPEHFGSEFKASDVKCDPKKQILSMNIAGAYPEQAAVSKWIRSYNLKKNELVINDSFNLKNTKQKNEINFLVWGKIDSTKKGQVSIKVNGQKAIMNYNASKMALTVDTINLTDQRFSKIWGDHIYRLHFIAEHLSKSGHYSFSIMKK